MPDTIFVRLKPKNKKKGYKLERLHGLGQIWQGGDGNNIIPRWYPVSPAVAQQLLYFRQTQEDPESPLAFDFCNKEQMLSIDRAEEYNRRATLGIVTPPVEPPGHTIGGVDIARGTGAAPQVTVAELNQQNVNLNADAVRQAAGNPTVMKGAEAYLHASLYNRAAALAATVPTQGQEPPVIPPTTQVPWEQPVAAQVTAPVQPVQPVLPQVAPIHPAAAPGRQAALPQAPPPAVVQQAAPPQPQLQVQPLSQPQPGDNFTLAPDTRGIVPQPVRASAGTGELPEPIASEDGADLSAEALNEAPVEAEAPKPRRRGRGKAKKSKSPQ